MKNIKKDIDERSFKRIQDIHKNCNVKSITRMDEEEDLSFVFELYKIGYYMTDRIVQPAYFSFNMGWCI